MKSFILTIVCLQLLLGLVWSGPVPSEQGTASVSSHESVVEEANNLKQIALFVVHRHGERTLAAFYPNNVYSNESYWPEGFGQLTNEGKRRMHKLGMLLRDMYNSSIDQDPHSVFVRSSGIDRCLDSASLVANGMYPPTGNWAEWNTTQTWVPIPVFTIHKPVDGMLNPGASCRQAEKEVQRVMKKSVQGKLAVLKHKPVMDRLAAILGFEINNLFVAKAVYDALHVEKINNLTLPSWATDDLMHELESLYDETFRLEFSTRKLQRLRTGVLLNEIKCRILKKFNVEDQPNCHWPKPDGSLIHWDSASQDHKNVFLYSTHDSLVAALANALHIFDNHAPGFGASILMELKVPQEATEEGKKLSTENITQAVIRIGYLRDPLVGDVEWLHLPGCQKASACTVPEFLDVIEGLEMTLDDWKNECQTGVQTSADYSGL